MKNCDTFIQDLFYAIEKGYLSQVQKRWREIDNSNVTDTIILNNVKDNENPLLLAMQSHMRDTVRKLINLGAQTDKYTEGLIHHSIYYSKLYPDTLARSVNTGFQFKRTNQTPVSVHQINKGDGVFSDTNYNGQVPMKQLQYQSTSYDLELARRKRELIRRLPVMNNLAQQSASLFLQLIQVSARADLAIDRRLLAVTQLLGLLPIVELNSSSNEIPNLGMVGSAGEPYLRLIEVCLCESHCPIELAVQFTHLAMKLILLSASKSIDSNGLSVIDDEITTSNSNTSSTHIVSYISKLLKKLILKSNAQYRSGILAHLSRIIFLSTSVMDDSNDFNSHMWSCDILSFSSIILSNLIRLGEVLDQPINVSRFAQLVSLIAHNLIDASKENSDCLSLRFSDLADILVGLAVDSSSISKGINLHNIYGELQNSLSYWFLVPLNQGNSFCVNENIREMITHLMEDSENSLNTVVNEYHNNGLKRSLGNSGKNIFDSNVHFMSVCLFLKILSSIIRGICNQISTHGSISFVELFMFSDDVKQWVKRLIHIIQSSASCYKPIPYRQNVPWHSTHSVHSAFHIPLSVLDSIETSGLQILSKLILFSDFNNESLQMIEEYLLSRISDTNDLSFSNTSLVAILDLIQAIFKIKYSTLITPLLNPNVICLYFGPHSNLHIYKTHTLNNKSIPSPYESILSVLCSLTAIESLQYPLFEFALGDFKFAFSNIRSEISESEKLGLFSISLISHLLKDVSLKLKNEMRSRISDIFGYYFVQWLYIPYRLRITILVLMIDSVVTTKLNSVYVQVLCQHFVHGKPSHMECYYFLSLVESILAKDYIDQSHQLTIFAELIKLSEYILVNKDCQSYSKDNTFVKCVNILVKYIFKCTSHKSNKKIMTKLLRLSQLASSYPCMQIQRMGSDLLLLLKSCVISKLVFPVDKLYSELNWFRLRRPDHSSTALLTSNTSAVHSSGASLLVSISAFPSLPAVAGVLGIITRGSPYNSDSENSRLKILRKPDDWIRRLSCIISPIPSDYKCRLELLQCTSFISPILWHAAWAVVDYKLKVAPWANPLKTFLALEGVLHAFLQPLSSTDHSSNKSQMFLFQLASSESQARQTPSRQLRQINLLLSFLNYLERIIFDAVDGFALTLPRPMASACHFFAANENTCTQWFNRIRNPIIRLNTNLPFMFSGNCMTIDEASCSTVYHAYHVLRNVMQYTCHENHNDWITNLVQLGGSTDMFINLSKALHDLGAWEELEALVECTDHLCHSNEKQFTWLRGIALLAQGQWDNAFRYLTNYLENSFISTKSETETKQSIDQSTNSHHIDSIIYVGSVLLQMYMSEGNHNSALELCENVSKFLDKYFPDDAWKLSNSSFALNCARIECVKKLSGWSSNSFCSNPNNESMPWSHAFTHKNLDALLVDTVNSVSPNNKFYIVNNLGKLTSIVRKTSLAMNVLPSINSVIDSTTQFGQIHEDGLHDWIIRTDLLLGKDFVEFSKMVNPVGYSSWVHLLSTQSKLHIGTEIAACQQACVHGNPELAQRLLLRTIKCLSLAEDNTYPSKCLEKTMDLRQIASFIERNKFKKLDPIYTLSLYDCLARISWLSEEIVEKDNKLFAFSMLTKGLKIPLLEENQMDANEQMTQCKLLADSALRLFDWLISPVDLNSQTWADNIYSEANACDFSQELKSSNNAYSIACDLDLFTQLADEPWVNGLPILTAQTLNPSTKRKLINCPALWTNRLLMMATHLSPTGLSPNAWLKMANWCYSRGLTEINEVQNAALKYITDKDKHNDEHPSIAILLKVLKPGESDMAISILNYHHHESEVVSMTNEQTRAHIPILVAALISFASPVTRKSSSNDNKDQEKIHMHLNFSSKCLDDHMDSQMMEDLHSYLVKTLHGLISLNLDSDLMQLIHSLSCSIHESLYTLHTSAAQAYATFLTIADQPLSNGNNSFTKLDSTSATLKILDLLCMPSRKLRRLISGFFDHASPIVPDIDRRNLSSFTNNQTSNSKMDKFGYLERIKSGPTLGGPLVWEACLPQLLVRLAMPDPIIRDCLVILLGRLIMRINGDDLHSRWCSPSIRLAIRLVFPAVIAASNLTDIRLDNVHTNDCKVYPLTQLRSSLMYLNKKSNSQDSTNLCSFNEILTALQKAGLGNLVTQVESFTFELQRITLLWEELWIGSLNQHVDELVKKITFFESEMKRAMNTYSNLNSNSQSSKCIDEKENVLVLSNNHDSAILVNEGKITVECDLLPNMLALKRASILQPTLDVLSQLTRLTLDVKPETSHEEWFQRTFGPIVNNLRDSLIYPLETQDIKQPLVLIRQLIHQLQTIHQPISSSDHFCVTSELNKTGFINTKTGNISYLNLYQLSPKLSNMRFGCQDIYLSNHQSTISGIPLPGHYGIKSSYLANRIAVLPTKTRPKRLLFRAENGRTYPYLLKGLEDLRLDDRIMQLFELTNLALAQHFPLSTNQLFARTYSVTPLGLRSGLLQMVQGAIPLFSLYKRWQIRSNKTINENSSAYAKMSLLRPDELFHSRLKDLLSKIGKQYQPNARQSWPLETLREVFHSLERETPADLLTRELWASNPSCASWWKVSQTFAKSAGLLSILGYLVGLGDRHLDNLLVDLMTGHIIHIDYNVCFDKGRNLRVAERVPFRLTRILRHALGPVAQDKLVRGTFRIGAENGLQVARTISHPFLIQLKAFIIDPLADWHHRKSVASHNLTITDFVHLSTFYGGGSAISKQNQITSIGRRLRRVLAEIRTRIGLLVSRIVELKGGACLASFYQALDSITFRLLVWTEWANSRKQACLLNERIIAIEVATKEELIACDRRCFQLKDANCKVIALHQDLVSCIETWNNEIVSHFEYFANLSISTLPNLILSCQSSDSLLSSALSKYYAIAKVYISSPDYNNVIKQTKDYFQEFFTKLQACLDTNSMDIDLFINTLSSYDSYHDQLLDSTIVDILQKSIQEYHDYIDELQSGKDQKLPLEPIVINPNKTVLHEVNNLILFVTDQGSCGVNAYCWALLNYLLEIEKTCFSLETDPKEWQNSNNKCPPVNDRLQQINMHAECLANFATVLLNPSSDTYNFNVGYEADVYREITFLNVVREATSCLVQLYTNLTRLLIPEAIEALASVDTNFVEKFTQFVVSAMAQSDTAHLRQSVDEFLMKTIVIQHVHESRLHQVLLGVHLALTNATAQMEEIAFKLRSNGITAPAWYYVDIVSQIVNILLSRCSSWQVGATSLWCWESESCFNGFSSNDDNTLPCSWADEIYASGLTAFISVLEDGTVHWSTIKSGLLSDATDLTLKPFDNAINLFIGRLISRISLASLVGLASSRLFCGLIENTGLSIRRGVVEAELSAKVTGLPSIISLLAEKLIESVGIQNSITQPTKTHHLRTSASNLIQRLCKCSAQITQCASETSEFESIERHLSYLNLSLSVYNWMHNVTCDSGTLTRSCGDLIDTLQLIQQALDQSDPHYDVALTIWSLEMIRTSGLDNFSVYAICLNLANDLKQAILDKEAISSSLSQLDSFILAIKNEYNIDMPVCDWNSNQSCGNSNMFEQLKADALKANTLVSVLSQRLEMTRLELCTNPDTTNEFGANSVQIKTSKRASRVYSHHARNVALSAIQNASRLSINLLDTNTSQPVVINSLRINIEKLQIDWLSEVYQLIKVLSRYEAFEINLIEELNQINGVQTNMNVFVWSGWLDKYQKWTTLVGNTFKKLSKFLVSASAPKNFQLAPNVANYQSDVDEEVELSWSIYHDFLMIKWHLQHSLILPIFDAIDLSIESDSQFSQILNTFLPSLRSDLVFEMKEKNFVDVEIMDGVKLPELHQQTSDSFNSHALTVWQCVYDRLHGFQSFPNGDKCESGLEPLSVVSQVDACIKEATNIDNLALMYEGWTAWV